MKKVNIITLLVACLLIVLSGCGKKQGSSQTSETSKISQTSEVSKVSETSQSVETISTPLLSGSFEGTRSLLDYAARLEAAGNREAAAAVYAFVGKVARKEMKNCVDTAMEGETVQELQFLAEMAQDNRKR